MRPCRRSPQQFEDSDDPGASRSDRDHRGGRKSLGDQHTGRVDLRDRPGHQPGASRLARRASPTGIAYGAGSLWVTNQADGTVSRIDPRARTVEATITVGSGPAGVALGDGAAWVANNLDGSLSRIDVEDNSVTSRTIARGGGAYGVAALGRAVWVSSEHAGTLSRVSTRRFTLLDTVRVGGALLGLAFVGDRLWFTNAAGGSSLHRGGVLTVVEGRWTSTANRPETQRSSTRSTPMDRA